MDDNNSAEHFTDGRKNTVQFPEHMLVIGRTNSGKSSLIGSVFSNINTVYRRYTKDNIIILISPHEAIDYNFLRRFNSLEDWKIIHFFMHSLNEEGMESVLKYLEKEKLLGKEIFLFLDDLAINGYASKRANSFILKLFSTFRHKNIAVIATVQVGDKEFKPLMENSGFIVIMKHFGYHKCLEMILRNFVTSIKVPTLIRSLSPFLGSTESIGDHIVINFSQAAMTNEIFFITNTIFEPRYGYTRRSIERMCSRLQ